MTALSHPPQLPLPCPTPVWRARVSLWLFGVIGLGLLCAGCASPGPKTKAQGGVFPRPGAKIAVGTVTNETGQTFAKKDVEAALKAALVRALESEQLAAGAAFGPKDLMLNARISEYRPGNAFKRWVMPGWGATVLGIKVDLTTPGAAANVAEMDHKLTVAAGGLYTVGAEDYIFDSAAKDIAHDLRVRIQKGGDFAIKVRPRGDVVAATEPRPGAKTIQVTEVQDRRPEKDRIGERSAAFGVSMGDVYLGREVTSFLREALEVELTAAGHRLATTNADVKVSCELSKFWLHTKTTPLYWDVITDMEIALVPEGQSGGTRQEFSATARKRTYVWPSATLCGEVVDACTDDLLGKVRNASLWQ